MTKYQTKSGSKAWSIILMLVGIAFFISGLTFFNNIIKNNGVLSLIIVFGVAILCVYKSISNWSDTIEIKNNLLIHKKIIKKTIVNLNEITKIQEISATQIYGKIDQSFGITPLGSAYNLIFFNKNEFIYGIKEIRSFENFELFYKEIENITNTNIEREIKQWENEYKDGHK